jgi:short-subunit dehydrogenase
MNQIILITGASTGIGRSTALYLAQEGYRVFAGVRNAQDAQSLKNEGIKTLEPIILDVTKPTDIEQVTDFLEKECSQSGLFALINNAGINYVAPFEVADEQKVRNLMEVNFFGLMNLTRRLIPLLQKFGQSQNQTAKVLNIGSIGGKIGLPWQFSYHASKFAVLSLSQSLRFELEALKIKVSCVMPGGIRTPFFTKSGEEAQNTKNNLSGSNSAYYIRNMTKMWDAAQRFERFATPPLQVAKVLNRLLKKQNPPLRKVIGMDAKIINWLVWLGWENLLKSQFVGK